MKRLIVVLVIFFLPLLDANAELCPTRSIDMPASTPTSPRFDFQQDGLVVTDNKTGLKWARCQWGYEWDVANAKCIQVSVNFEMPWKDALKEVKDDPLYLGEQGWRVPNIKELASIVEHKCHSPAINNEVFPGTASGIFWTNSHVIGSSNIRTINFSTGEVGNKPSTEEHMLRLVKDAN